MGVTFRAPSFSWPFQGRESVARAAFIVTPRPERPAAADHRKRSPRAARARAPRPCRADPATRTSEDESVHLERGHVAAHRAGILSSLEREGERGPVAPSRARGAYARGPTWRSRSASKKSFFADPSWTMRTRNPKKASPGSGARASSRVGYQPLHAIDDDGQKQRSLRREATVERADPEPRAPRELLLGLEAPCAKSGSGAGEKAVAAWNEHGVRTSCSRGCNRLCLRRSR
jgi:hypothetical protein